MNINKVLNNPENMYYGHGTGTDNQEITNSIIKNGLRCSHGSLYYTSVTLGMGTHIEETEIEMMKHWPHKNSNIIIVVSLPIKYKIIDSPGIGTYNMADAAFYYTPSKITGEHENLNDSSYVMPEFIAGYYDARKDSFTQNPRYYEKLSIEEQQNLFDKVNQNYFNIIEEGCGIEKYQEIISDLGYDFPLTSDEIIKYKKKRETKELLLKLGENLLKKQIFLPDGNKITVDKYIREIVLQFIPAKGYIILANGNKLPISHFIMECVLYDCQKRYNGNFSKYIKDNVDIEKTKQINGINEITNHKKR